MNSKSLSALLYVGLCLALCLTGVQLAIAASVPDGLDPARRALETSIGTPEAYAEAGVWLVEAFDDRLVLAVSAGEPSITHVQLPDGSVCQEVSLPGYQSIAEPGHPALPSATAALGIPITSSPTVRIVDSESIRLPGVYALCPEPSPVLNSDVTDGMTSPVSSWQRIPHPDAFNKDAPIPANTVEIASTGSIRDQRIAQLVAQPLQYNPVSGEIRIFTQMTVEVRLNVTPSDTEVPLSANPNAAVQPFEGLLRSYLLNYEQATAWRNVPSPAATGEIAANILLKATATGTPVYRIEIREAGLYQLAYTDLQAADPSIDLASVDPRTFHLSTHGQEVAIEVTGQDDSSFDLGDAIYFYAETINTVYANTNVYWLTWNETAGLRMIMLDATPSGTAQVPEHFTTTLHLEEDLAYRRALVTADGDNWFWSDLRDTGTPATASYTFQIPNLAVGALTATLGGDLLGYGTVAYHSVEVHLNNQRVHSATWATQTEHQFEVSFPHSYLVPGTNVLSVTIGVGNLSDYVVVNRFALTHAALYTATNDQLWFDGDHAGTWEFQLSGFTTDTVRILDITDPISPVRIAAGPSQYGGLTYTLPFEQSLSGERRYLAVATAQVRSPISVSRDAVSDLHSTSNSADYIVISHGSLITSAQALADYRGTQGLRSQVVDVLDIYDEFNFGIPDAAAIREFLAYAYANWTAPAPAYVVLFGDGHYDPKDNLGRGEPSLVPPYLAAVDPWIRETAADNRYVTIDGDNLPDMFLGRLPANTLEQANVLVNKIIVYEQPSAAGAWQAKLLFVADNEDSAGNFAEDSNAVADHYIPDPYAVDKVYLGVTHPITVEARAAITAAINEGRLIVNYAGHGATQLWAGERLLSLDSMPFLINAGRLPFFVPMTCLEGYFIIPSPPGDNYAALAELVVRLPTGGAIASWSATGLGLASGHDYLNRGLYEAIFQEDMIELGPATAYAKQYLAISPGGRYFSDLLETYTLFGDPALRLAVLADVQIDKQIVPDRARFVAGDTITYTLTYSNAGSAVAYGVVITDILPTSVALPAVLTAGATITSRLGNTFVWDVADLYPGAGGIITITGVVSVTLEAPSFANTARISTISAEEDILDNTTTVFANAQQSYLPLILKGFATP